MGQLYARGICQLGLIVKTSEKRPTSLQGPKDLFPMRSLFGGFTVYSYIATLSVMLQYNYTVLNTPRWCNIQEFCKCRIVAQLRLFRSVSILNNTYAFYLMYLNKDCN